MPRLDAAYQWLKAGHQGSVYAVHVATSGASAAYYRDGLAGDSGATFTVRHLAGERHPIGQIEPRRTVLQHPRLRTAFDFSSSASRVGGRK